jgi:hypothetical protein
MNIFNVSTLASKRHHGEIFTQHHQVNANIIIQQTQVETQAMIQANRAATEDILLQILTNQEDMRRIVQYQDAGQHVAERVMEAGQLVSGHIPEITFWA